LENLVMTGACLSSNEERVVFLRVIKILTFSDCADCEWQYFYSWWKYLSLFWHVSSCYTANF